MSDAAPKKSKWRARIRGLLWSAFFGSFVLAAFIAFLIYWTSSPGFESWLRRRLEAKIEQATGGRV